jgi:Tol biopolymer transport system component
MLLPLDGSGPSRELLVDATLNQSNAAVSPDGQWIAYESNKTKTAEVYVRPFPAVSGREWMVSVGGGSRPVWARSGRELLYVEGGQGTRLMTVAIQPGAAFNYGKPQVWLDMGRYSLGKRNARWYDVASDGRVLALKSVGDETLTRDAIVTVTHWFDEVAARVK